MRNKLLVVGCALLCFFLSYTSLNTDVGSDPKLTLLVSQAIVEHGTTRLDAYADDTILGVSFGRLIQQGHAVTSNGHIYNYYPVGPSLISVPVVAVARLSGLDMRTTDNYGLQRMLAALSTAVVFCLAYVIVRCYLPAAESLIISLISVLGSSLISTLGTAFWSHNYVVIFIGIVLWLLARRESGRSATVHPVWLGLLLFLSFLCRASTAAFILPTLLYLLWTDRRAAVIAGAVAFVGLVAFLGWSAVQTGQLLPAYYQAGRFDVERVPVWVGIYGNLLSPSRGILIFSPFLIPVVIGLLWRGRLLWRRSLVWLCLIWFALNFWAVARAASWWGGWSFGPRILVDIWPGLILLTAIVWQALARRSAANRRPSSATLHSPISNLQSRIVLKRFAVTYTLLGFLAILLHVGMGLNSQVASRWNASVRPLPLPGDTTLGDLFNWKYAQPIASNRMLCSFGGRWFANAMADYGLPLTPYSPGQEIDYNGDQFVPWPNRTAVPHASAVDSSATIGHDQALLPFIAKPGNLAGFQGWGDPFENSRWSQCYDSQIYLYIAGLPPSGHTATLTITAAANGPQAIEVTINGEAVGTLYRTSDPQTTSLDFPASLLLPHTLNLLNFHFPDAHYPNFQDQRPLGMAFTSLKMTIDSGPVAAAGSP